MIAGAVLRGGRRVRRGARRCARRDAFAAPWTARAAEAIVTDVGSTKRSVTEAISDPRFVAGHPLAGAEAAGVEHARNDLFEGATWYLTPATGAPECGTSGCAT